MTEIIFLFLIFASMLTLVVAWTLALRESRLSQAWIEQTARRVVGPTPLKLDRDQREIARPPLGR